MDKIVVEGGRRLEGLVSISGAKNAALPILAAALLTDGTCRFTNVPDLRDIHSIVQLLQSLGARVEQQDDTVVVNAAGLASSEAPYDLVRKMRASILVLGPLLARLQHARVSLPGGCAIGARPINLHLKGLALMGAEIDIQHGYVEARAKRLKGAEIYFDTVSVTGTENLLMAASLAEGETVLRNAAREPEVVALAEVLNLMGARIEGAGTAVIKVRGVDHLNAVEARIIPDRIEAGTFMVAAALTAGDVTLEDCEGEHLGAVCDKLVQAGVHVEQTPGRIRVQGTRSIESLDVRTQTYPGFPTDMQAQFMVLMSIARGQSIITETIFENRFIHVSELKRLGADIVVSGETAVIRGRPSLSGAPVMASDLRASASLVLAGLVAEGVTEVNRVYHLDRGYEHIEAKLQRLGASIWRERV
ncbi:MAG: UDP-N-acetylglucosamine 1-carboxyvinyltransferase [Desulfobacterales bacterium]|nr:UDP-N-acetylglucosamine 1-carboxyvinyltransferase [Desulfobacterales bacterium]MDJ0876218.1 UDP-N-acetylglucosamine 1-carboxyvinyltransferase [Desulfobacterales bacterium]MDJ0882647.1 UDP-N-acetylglucosamine 1-carboxyvinyltransferase [Desulfobacterales bacterium]